MNPENDFNLYKDNSYTHWRKSILFVSLIAILVIFFIEIGIYLTLLKSGQRVAATFQYVFIRIILPTGINFTSLLVCTIICKNKNISTPRKNSAAGITVYTICSVVAIFHNYFHVLLVSCAFPFFICLIFGNTKILNKLGILTIPSFTIAAITFYLDKETGQPLYKILTLLCTLAFIICSYLYANTQVKIQKNQLDYIHLSYQRQFELLEELRIDPLTNIANRVSMKEIATNAIYHAEKQNISSYLVMLDLDFFKSVNDRFGHTSGDVVLVKLAEILRANTEILGHAFRYGGEEFILIFENTNLETVSQIVKKICSDFSKTRFDFSPEEAFTLSAGISLFQKGSSLIQWINNSDSALYYAKTHGRNQFRIFEELNN